MLKVLKKALILRAIKNGLPFGQKRSTLKSTAINQGLLTLGSIGVGVGVDLMKNGLPFGQRRSRKLNKGLLTLGSIGVGVGLMYLLDPDLGHRRRDKVREKFARGVKVPSRPSY
ncbi:MAG: hypothetical protein L0220_17250 [Acidobacteria bacterium]|nr:hypothetical protein [Acidobacteriota bacterium]